MLRATRTQAPRTDLRAGGELHSLRLAVEIEVAVHGLRGVAHLARAAYRDAAGALHVEGEFAAGIFLVGELAIALRTGVAQHLRRIVALLLRDAARFDDRSALRHPCADPFGGDID